MDILEETTPLPIEYASLSDRIQSIFIDSVFIIMLMILFSNILDKYEDDVPDWIRIALFFGLWAVYEPLSTTLGCTIGNYIKGIRIRSHKDTSKRINIFQSLVRYITKCGLGWVSFFTVHSNPQRRAIHDFAAGSVSIKKVRSSDER